MRRTDRAHEVEVVPVPPGKVVAGLALLREAHEYAAELGRDAWEFAVEIQQLRSAGLSHAALRWLVCAGYAEHAAELPVANGQQRQFRRPGNLAFSDATCFSLTAEGVRLAEALLNGEGSRTAAAAWEADPAAKPVWDGDRRELSWGGVLVKQYRLPAANQTTILAAFQEDGWPSRIDDPLPGGTGVDPIHRLHEAIRGLNRNQIHCLLRFAADGTGGGIVWEAVSLKRETRRAHRD